MSRRKQSPAFAAAASEKMKITETLDMPPESKRKDGGVLTWRKTVSSFQVKPRRQPDTEKNITPTLNSCIKVVKLLTATLCHRKGGRTHGLQGAVELAEGQLDSMRFSDLKCARNQMLTATTEA